MSENRFKYIAYLPPDGSSPIVRNAQTHRKLSKAQAKKWMERFQKKREEEAKAEEAKKEEEPPKKEEEK